MSIFNKVFGKGVSEKIALNSAEAFAAIALVAIASDGYLSESEETEMKMRLGRMRLFKSSMDSFERTKDYLVDALKKHGPSELIQCAKASLPPTLAPTAFTIAVDLVFSDGTVSSEEQSFIDDLRQILAIPDEMALKIVEVITIKNQG
ncbi:MAG: Tellurite resistance protein TerB [Leptolyngbya foveolarum]|uniref:Tellurite resistance protein TerB n=1 Tax=Leptolyngbya foveolarum TaxID=47253 RepID=A0A2W4U4G5_9CYAN|nr:MAG: Tellurite resistance protein TerB [Leptolyngbya foveolarum]